MRNEGCGRRVVPCGRRGERLSVMKEGIGGGNELGSDLGLLYVGENRVRSTLHPIPIPILYQP